MFLTYERPDWASNQEKRTREPADLFRKEV
jgi:hypothetical protein